MADQQVRRVEVRGVISGDKDIKKMADALTSVSKSTKNVENSFSSLKNLTGAIAGGTILGFGVRELVGISDNMTQLTSRLNVFVGEGEKSKQVFSDLASIANQTKAPLGDIAQIFTRIAVATERLNLSTDLQLGLVKVLQNSFKLSGASTEEATASTIQFTQALSFGQLRGQELRSVLSQNATLATIFGKAIEGSGKDIYKFAEAGGFTTKFVLKALFENMEMVDKKAGSMSQTFGQTLNVVMNAFTIKIKDLNEQFKLNEGFAKFVDFMLEKGPTLSSILTVLAVSAIPKLVLALQSLTTASILSISTVSLFAGAIAALTAGAIYAAGSFNKFVAEVKTLPAVLSLMVLQVGQAAAAVLSLGTTLVIDNPLNKFFEKNIAGLKQFIQETRKGAADMDNLGKPLEKAFDVEKLLKEVGKLEGGKKLTITEQIGQLNTQFNRGTISADKFIKEINRLEIAQLNEKLSNGSVSLLKFGEEMEKIKLEDMARKLEAGKINITEFNSAINNFKIEQLNEKFRRGKIDLEDYTKKLRELKIEGMDPNNFTTGIAKGLNNVIVNLGSTSDMIAGVVTNAFQGMEDAIFKATKSGELNFSDMTQAILDDITKIAIRMAIVKPLAEGLLGGLFGPSTSGGGFGSAGGGAGGFADVAAKGAMYDSGVKKFASGGIVDSPTMFGIAGGRKGLMGEAGPEAIVPLKRGANGDLGVQASPTIININNMAGAEVTTTESRGPGGQKQIDVMIQAKVREGIANGAFDKQFRGSFGMKRVGV